MAINLAVDWSNCGNRNIYICGNKICRLVGICSISNHSSSYSCSGCVLSM